MSDSMMDDIAADYDRPILEPLSLDDGRRHWPDLFFARPAGFRPLALDLHVPPGEGPFPVVVYIHGGAWIMGHPKVANPILNALNVVGSLNAAGFAVARVSYRMSAEAQFPAQLHDCKAAVRYLRKHCETLRIDPERVAAMGESAGGHLACLLGLTGNRPDLEGTVGETGPSSHVQAVVDWYGPTDFLTMDEQRPAHATQSHDEAGSPESRLVGSPIRDDVAATRAASPITYANPDAPPFLIQHGTDDRLVPIGQARVLAKALRSHGVAVELIEIENADHCFWGVDTGDVMPAVIDFLTRTIGGTTTG